MGKKAIEVAAKYTVVSKENPFTKGTGVYKRVQAVLTSKSKGEAIKKGAKSSTVRWAVNNKIIKVAA